MLQMTFWWQDPVEHKGEFAEEITNRFDSWKATIDRPIIFDGCEISWEADGGMKIYMTKYMSTIEAINIDMKHKANQLSKPIRTRWLCIENWQESLFRLKQESCPKQPSLDQKCSNACHSLKLETWWRPTRCSKRLSRWQMLCRSRLRNIR